MLAMVIEKLAPPPTGSPVLHFAPEPATLSFLKRKYGEAYTPADFDPSQYPWVEQPMRQIDLARPLEFMPVHSVQGLVHSHVLEHVPGDLTQIVLQMNEAIEPGGFHIFCVPFFSPWYREDMDPAMTHDDRDRLFGQFDHLRSFGTSDFEQRMGPLFKDFERLRIDQFFTQEDMARAAVPIRNLTSLTSHSVFFYQKN